jgi:hypothetical protein
MNDTSVGPAESAGGPRVRTGFGLPSSVFPVYLATWRGRDGRTATVLLLGNFAGGYLLRTVVVEASGTRVWDDATPFPPAMDPEVLWDRVEQQLDLVGATGAWGPDEPSVVDATGFEPGAETARAR